MESGVEGLGALLGSSGEIYRALSSVVMLLVGNSGKNLADIKLRNDHRTNWSKAFLLSQAQIAYVWHPSAVPYVAMQALRDGMYNVSRVYSPPICEIIDKFFVTVI